MDVRVIYNVPYIIPLGLNIAVYFYITGLHMGFYTTSVVATLIGKKEWKPIGKIGAVGAVVILTIAPIFLLIDLTQIPRFWHLFVYLNITSPITWGTFFLTSYPIIGLFYAWYVLKGRERLAKILGLVGFPIAVSVHGYTGFILVLGKGRVFWNASLNPILFLVSAMVSGLAVIIIIANIRRLFFAGQSTPSEKENDARIIDILLTMLIIFIIIDLVLLGSDLAALANSTQDAHYMFTLLTAGKFSFWFLGVEILMGELIPLIMLSVPRIKTNLTGQNIAAAFVLIGIFVMRIIIVIGGQSVPLH